MLIVTLTVNEQAVDVLEKGDCILFWTNHFYLGRRLKELI